MLALVLGFFASLPALASSLPIEGTDVAEHWDSLYWFLIWLSVFFFILVIGAMIYFAIKYRRGAGLKPKYITGNHALEAVWIIVPTVLLMVIFGWGYSVYRDMTQAPSDAYEIRVIGKQWMWQFQYDNGRTETGSLYVPLNHPVKLVMTSQDVIHSFFVPSFRIKQDVVPGMYTSVWFEAKVPGQHQVFCAEYCGTSHSGMLAKVVVLDDQQWKAYLSGRKLGAIPNAVDEASDSDDAVRNPALTQNLALQGKNLFEARGCVSCHSSDGTQKIGPSHKGLYGSQVRLTDGKTVVADENYIRESIESPQAKIVQGYSPVMPTFKGIFSETEMNALIAYIKSLK